jgi:benzoyl-CoA reductase subunit C
MSNPRLSVFKETVDNCHEYARKLARERPVIGYFCDFVPEELLHAAGFVPIRITGTRMPVSFADKHLQSNVCSFARSCLELVLDGTYRYLTGVVIPHSCDVITKMNDLWAYRVDYPAFCHYLWYPHKANDAGACAAFLDELRRLKSCLQEFSGREVTDAALRESIALYNEDRRLLAQAYELRKKNSPPLTGTDSLLLTLSSMLMPKEDHVAALEQLLSNMGEKPAHSAQNEPRLLVSASVLDDTALIQLIERSGATVVCDDVCTGIRYFHGEVVGDADPLEALAERYLNKIPCPRTFDSTARIDFLMQNVRDYRADGVIIYLLRCCDAHLFEMPGLQERLKASGTPVLYLQGDHSAAISEETRNRIAAFTEMLGGRP